MEISPAPSPDASITAPGSVLGASVAAQPLEGSLEHIDHGPALSNLRAVDVATPSLYVTEQPVVVVTIVLGGVTNEADAIADAEHALDRCRRCGTPALFPEVDLGRIDAD